MFFVDHSIMGLLVQENYLRSVEKKPVSVELLNRCAFSADLMTLGDVINGKIRTGQNWSLLPDVALASAVYPAHITNGFVAFPNFPAFLGKYSTQSKMNRLATELQTHLKLSAQVSRWNLATSGFAELLYKRCVRPLMQDEDADVMETVGILDAYGLRKEHLMEHLTEMREHLGEEDLFKLVDPKVKAAMTREFNTGGHAVKVMLPSGGKKRKAPEENPDDVGDDAEVDKVLFRGVNVVFKDWPYYPWIERFHSNLSFVEADVKLLRALGVNLIRLGVMWPGAPKTGKQAMNRST